MMISPVPRDQYFSQAVFHKLFIRRQHHLRARIVGRPQLRLDGWGWVINIFITSLYIYILFNSLAKDELPPDRICFVFAIL